MAEWFCRRVARRGRGFEPHIPRFTVCVVTSTHSGLKHFFHFFPLDQVALGERVGEVVEAICTAARGGMPGGFTPVTSEGAVGESCWSESELQRDEAELQRDEAEMRMAAEGTIAEAAAPTEGWLADAGTPVGSERGATGGRTLGLRPGRCLRKREGGRRLTRPADSTGAAEEIGHPCLGHGERCGGGGPA